MNYDFSGSDAVAGGFREGDIPSRRTPGIIILHPGAVVKPKSHILCSFFEKQHKML
jgi:hypothetical protein